jgi:hypothetical protein
MNRFILACMLATAFSGKLFSQAVVEVGGVDSAKAVFEKVDIEASFPGGIDAWRKFLERHLNPSVPVENGAPCGMYNVYAQFIVNKDGKVSGIKALTNMGFGMEQEVVRILRESGAWTPAMQNGRPVNAYRKQPVTFMVEQDGFNIRTKTPYVLYTKVDNELTLEIDDFKLENLDVTISQGTIMKKDDATYLVRVNKPGRVTVSVTNRKKKDHPVGAVSFDVRSNDTETKVVPTGN